MRTDGPIRIGKTTDSGHEVVVVELLGVPLAESAELVSRFDELGEEFVTGWQEYFAGELVRMLAERMRNSGHRPLKWTLANPLAPPLARLPKKGEEK